jgi:hypothetical protein
MLGKNVGGAYVEEIYFDWNRDRSSALQQRFHPGGKTH